MLIISKLLPLLIYPVGLAGLLAIASGVLCLIGRRRTAAGLAFAAVGLLWFFANGAVAHAMVRGLESQYNQPDTFPQVPAIVLLGGGASPPVPPRRYAEVNEATGDRIMHAARLLRTGCAPCIIPTGGRIPFVYNFAGSEAVNMRMILTESLGIDSSRILLEPRARNTRENALYTRQLMQEHGMNPDIILVTSALHMPRSAAIFRKAGFTVHPAPTDYLEDARFQWTLFSLLPRAEALHSCTTAMHEYVGMVMYKLLGWM